MKQIGVTMGGTMVIEVTASEARYLNGLAGALANLPEFPGQPAAETCAAELPTERTGGRRKRKNKFRKAYEKAAKKKAKFHQAPGGGKTLRQIADEALREAGRALNLDELLGSMKKAGAKFAGKNPRGTVSVLLSTYKEMFSRVGHGLWTVKGAAVPRVYRLAALKAADAALAEKNPLAVQRDRFQKIKEEEA